MPLEWVKVSFSAIFIRSSSSVSCERYSLKNMGQLGALNGELSGVEMLE